MAVDPLNSAGLTRLRRKISDENSLAYPDDNDLQDIYQNEAGGNFTLTVALAFEELWSNATRFSDYTQNQSQEKKSQIFDHLEKMVKHWHGKYLAELHSTKSQVRIAGMRINPNREQAKPRS